MCNVLASKGRPWDNGARPKGAGNTSRPLTHSLDFAKEGMAVEATREHRYFRIGSVDAVIEMASLGGRLTHTGSGASLTVGNVTYIAEYAR